SNAWEVVPGGVVTFDTDGGTPATIPEQRRRANETATAPDAPTKADFQFAGWYDGDNAEYTFQLPVTNDVALTAHWANAVACAISANGATTNYFATIQGAVNAVEGNGKVVLLADTTEGVVNANDKAFTIDLNGKTWQSTSDVLATTAGTITIDATNGGTMKTEGYECCAVWAKGGDVVINGGEFVSKDNEEATIYVSNADSVVTINGGTFQNTAEGAYAWGASLKPLTLNVKNDLLGAAHIVLKGGTFYGNDPQRGDDAIASTDAAARFVSLGYVAMPDGEGKWNVVEGGLVTFDTDGGTPAAIDEQRIAKGGKVTKPADPVKDNFEFTGWNNVKADPVAAWNFDTDTVSTDVELKAQWSGAVAIVIADNGATTNYFATLAGAVAAAANGNTVALLDNVTIDARVEPNLGEGTTLTIDLNGKTITRTDTSGNGSAFDVKSGNVTITNGAIDCTQDDSAIAADGVYAITSRSGSNVTLSDLAVTVNSECGACAYPFEGSTMS
ncbi:MAG: InlB B-repeat-containing protein, partial [Kiritimatiellae bacterium]|nr:InlB B-repeat-containing protein [Kiritimatiellia bacterium]